jgi:hypothetical protein
MKKSIIFLSVISLLLLFCACSQDPLEPNATQASLENSGLAKETLMAFSGESWSDWSSIVMGHAITLPSGIVHMRQFLISTDEYMNHDWVTGRVNWVVHWNTYTDGSDVRWGTGEMVIEGVGRWDMVYKGWMTAEGEVTYEVKGTGKGELIKGLKAYWTYIRPVGQQFFDVTGYMVKHGN